MSSAVDLSLVVPAYQESKRIEATLVALANWLEEHDYGTVEVVVVTANSTDGTADLVRPFAARFKHFQFVEPGPKVGKGRDVRAGMLAAKGQVRLFMDADLATPLAHIDSVVAAIKGGADVAIAVRDLSSSHTGIRRLLSSAGNALVQLLLLPGVKDTQCGFKAFTAQATETIFPRLTIMGWGFDMEALAIARIHHYKIVQVVISDWTDKPDGTFEDDVSGAAVQTLKDLFMIVGRKLTGRYGAAEVRRG